MLLLFFCDKIQRHNSFGQRARQWTLFDPGELPRGPLSGARGSRWPRPFGQSKFFYEFVNVILGTSRSGITYGCFIKVYVPQKLLWSVERVFLGRAVEMRVRGSFVIILSVFFLSFYCSCTAFYRQTQLGWFVVPGGEAATTWSVFPTYCCSASPCVGVCTTLRRVLTAFYCHLKCV